ncbi:MAG TPA: nuclear transport factor 2 family protein [Candidatus Elarobacter sp.]|jgi:ketosteroid isomerase-like protein
MATTDVEQENIAAVRRGFEAFQAQDMGALTQLFREDATWGAEPTGVIGGNRTGRNDIFTMFGQLGQETQGAFKVVPSAFAASGDQVFARCTATGTRNGKTLESDQVLIFTMADGQVRDVQFFMHDYPANADFWA